MWRKPTVSFLLFVASPFLFGAILSGCHTAHGLFGVDRCADIPAGAIPQPLGSHACRWQTAQASLAEQDDFVIYEYEWGDAAQPTQFGRDHLETIASRLSGCPYHVVIQRSGDEALDRQRQQAVVEFLAAKGHTSPQRLVVVGKPAAEGLDGNEAINVARGLLMGGSSSGGGQGMMGGGMMGGGGMGGLGSAAAYSGF